MNYMNDSSLWAQGSKCYEQLRVGLTWTTVDCDLKALDVMNNSRLWMICVTLGCELKVVDALNISTLLVIWITQDPMSLGL